MKLFRLEIPYGRYEWISNGALQLQRLAYAEAGIGDWHCGDETVPLTRSVTDLPPLDLSDKENPRVLIVTEQKADEPETDNSSNADSSDNVAHSSPNVILEQDKRSNMSTSDEENQETLTLVHPGSTTKVPDTANNTVLERQESVEAAPEDGRISQ